VRILHTISSVNPAGGGPIEGVRQLGKVNTLSGHTVEIASLDEPNASFLKDFGFPVHALGPSSLGYCLAPRYVPWLRDNASKYDIIIVNGIWQYTSFGAWRALGQSSTPYVVFTHGMLDPWFKRRYPLKHFKKWLYWPWAEYRVLRDAAAVLFTCEEERLLARQSFWMYSVKERVVNYGTAEPTGSREDERRQLFNRFPELVSKRILLFMGRIHPKKGCDVAIQSFAATLAEDPRWHLVIAGPDQTGWKSSLQSLAAKLNISDQVTWTGMISGSLKWGLIKSSEVFFLPSHQENFGIVVAEALACGVPALISNKVNIWREVQNDGAGLVANDDLNGATTLLKHWHNLDSLSRDRMRAAARASFEKRFEIHGASRSLLSVLSEVLDKRASRTTQ